MNGEEVFFSLIICTYKRCKELERLFHSIERQKYKNYEIILIDQNEDDLIADVLAKFHGLNIIYKKVSRTGLSAARNAALKLAKGVFCAFPDDDCWYPENVLQKVHAQLKNIPADGLSVLITDSDINYSAGGIMSSAPWEKISKQNVWFCGNSSGLFLRRKVLLQFCGFRKDLGVGSGGRFQSGEDTEILLRLLKHDCTLYYTADIMIIHPPIMWYGNKERAFYYGCGGGRILAQYDYSLLFALAAFGWKLFLSMKALCKADLKMTLFHFYFGTGKIITFIKYYRHPQVFVFWFALFLAGIIALTTAIPANDTVNRYAPMADAFVRGDWVHAFHPRSGVFFTAAAGLLSIITASNGIAGCQMLGCLLFAFSVFPLYKLFAMIWNKKIAITGVLLYSCCSHLLRYPADGLRDNGKTLAFALITLGLTGLYHNRQKISYGIYLIFGMSLLTVLRGEGAVFALIFGLWGAYLVFDVRKILKGCVLFLLLISPQLIYNTWAIGYPVPETRHAYFLKRLNIPPLNPYYVFREAIE